MVKKPFFKTTTSTKIGIIHRSLIFHEAKNEMITNTYFLFSRELENNLENVFVKEVYIIESM